MFKKIYWYLFVYDLNASALQLAAKAGQPLNKKLQKDITLLVLCSYLLLIFNTFLPLISDTLAHTFWKKEHLSTVHKFKGKLHVSDEVADAATQTEKDKSTGNSKSFEFGLHLLSMFTYTLITFSLINLMYPLFRTGSPICYASITYRPPEGLII